MYSYILVQTCCTILLLGDDSVSALGGIVSIGRIGENGATKRRIIIINARPMLVFLTQRTE